MGYIEMIRESRNIGSNIDKWSMRLLNLYDDLHERILLRVGGDGDIPEEYNFLLDYSVDVVYSLIEYFRSRVFRSRKGGMYVEWMVRLYLGGEKLEDFGKVFEVLEEFEKGGIKGRLLSGDINYYGSTSQLYLAVVGLRSRKEEKRVVREDIEIIYESSSMRIFVPLSHRSAVYWGIGTSWCTVLSSTSKYYDMYMGQGKLYNIHILDGNNNILRKFQLHYESDQFCDESDSSIMGTDDIELLSRDIGYVNFLDSLIEEHYGFFLKNVGR